MVGFQKMKTRLHRDVRGQAQTTWGKTATRACCREAAAFGSVLSAQTAGASLAAGRNALGECPAGRAGCRPARPAVWLLAPAQRSGWPRGTNRPCPCRGRPNPAPARSAPSIKRDKSLRQKRCVIGGASWGGGGEVLAGRRGGKRWGHYSQGPKKSRAHCARHAQGAPRAATAVQTFGQAQVSYRDQGPKMGRLICQRKPTELSSRGCWRPRKAANAPSAGS